MSQFRFRPLVEQLTDRLLPATYTFTELPTLGGNYSMATDINSSGEVVGAADTVNGLSRAVLWTNGTVIDLGTLGGQTSRAEAINDRGQITGQAQLANGAYRTFRLTPEDSNGDGRPDRWFRDFDGDGDNDLMTPLNPIGGKSHSGGTDINSHGDIVGFSGDAWEGFRATVWFGNAATDVGTLGGTSSTANGINDAGQVVGAAKNAAGRNRPFLWSPTTGMTDLGQHTFFIGTADSITASGRVNYRALDLQSGNYSSTYIWTPQQPNGSTGSYAVLSALPPYDELASATDIIDAGWAVGTSAYFVPPFDPELPEPGYYVHRAVVWENGVPAELNPLISGAPGVGIDSPTAVNMAGQIAGNRVLASGHARAVMLTPQSTQSAVRITDHLFTEGNNGTTTTTFTVTLSAASSQTISVTYATANGSATAGDDYQARSGTLVFAPGEISKTISIPIIGDRLPEPNETFFINLSNATNATIADGQGVGTIIDDEPRISIGDVSMKEGRKGTTTLFSFTVTLSIAYDQPVTMSFSTVNGSAKSSDGDYVARTGAITFNPGETSKTITIQVKGDSKKEGNEYFYLDLFNNSSSSLFTRNRGIGTILNDD